MKQQKMLNTNNGITLIALVITIIVMLILVAVTISMAVNGGLFEYAGNAGKQTNNAIRDEQQLASGKVTIDNTLYNSIDEYLLASGNGGNSEEEDNIQNPEPEPDTPSGNGITAGTVQSNLTTYLGQKIAYGGTYTDASSYGNGDWEIFYADGEHIYIITRGHLDEGALTVTGYNGTTDFTEESISTKYPAVGAGLLNQIYDPTAAGTEADPYLKYTITKANMKATQYLLDSTVWASYANNEYAEWAIGGPTLELLVKSYNAYYPDKVVRLGAISGNGYSGPFSASNSLPSGTYLNHSTNYWLACPPGSDGGGVYVVNGSRANVGISSWSSNLAFRPIVCLDSDVQITWDEATSAYTISRAS